MQTLSINSSQFYMLWLQMAHRVRSARSDTSDADMDGMAERDLELQRLQRQLRLMDGDRKAYCFESGDTIKKQKWDMQHGCVQINIFLDSKISGTYFWVLLVFFSSSFNSLWPSDAIWQQRSGSTLAHVMACCLTASSDCLNECWLIITEVL